MSAENIATAMVMFKQVSGSNGGGDFSKTELSSMQSQISQIMNGLNQLDKTVQSGSSSGNSADMDKVRYLDSKTLYWATDRIVLKI